LKNAHLLRCAHPASLRRTYKYASCLVIACKQVSETARALHLSIFEQPVFKGLFDNLPRVGFVLFTEVGA
jgi:hypothetical protein